MRAQSSKGSTSENLPMPMTHIMRLDWICFFKMQKTGASIPHFSNVHICKNDFIYSNRYGHLKYVLIG
jgi:hypothetical protein